MFNIAVIGGGPAGIMAAISAVKTGAKVLLLEKNKEILNKFLLTGNGRCNLANAEFNLVNLVKNYNKSAEFLFHAFSVFGPDETIKFFNSIGIKTKSEKNNRVFPVSESAKDVRNILTKQLFKNNITVTLNANVKNIIVENNKISKIILADKKEIKADKYILCTGGKAYPKTGSDGYGYKMAEKLGHKINDLLPALVPIIVKEEWIKELQGISLKNIKIAVFQNNKKQASETGDIIFTHFGLSGPAVLNLSRKMGGLLKTGEVKIFIDLNPITLIPKRMARVLAKNNKMENFEITCSGLMGFEQAMVTSGGILLKEIDAKTMKSKIIDNLFFAGEIIDIDGKTGGFNLQACWSTGYLAGQSAARFYS